MASHKVSVAIIQLALYPYTQFVLHNHNLISGVASGEGS